MQRKYYWPVCNETNEVVNNPCVAEFLGGIYHFPKNALCVEPLPPKEGFSVVAKKNLNGTDYIEDHRNQTIYNISDCTASQLVTELGSIKKGYTLNAPMTQFDQWDGIEWITNIYNQYQHQFNHIDDIRRNKYAVMIDPLFAEARVKRLQGNDIESEVLENQALAAREKIQRENPWPDPPLTD